MEPDTGPRCTFDATTPIARFLVSSNEFARTQGLVKPVAFKPNRNLRTSVSRTDSLAMDDIARIGSRVAEQRQKQLYGWAALDSVAVLMAGLTLVPDEPPPRHMNIEGWPAEPDAQLSRQQILASSAELVLINAT